MMTVQELSQPKCNAAAAVSRWHIIVLLILPWLLFVANRNWPFQGFGHMDPWYYFGRSLNFPRYDHLMLTYPAERLTWILPARLFVIAFTPILSWLLFHVFVYCVSVLSVYFITSRLFGAKTAMVAATLMAVDPLFIGSNGWTYVDSGTMAYLSLALASLVAFRDRPNSRKFLVASGMFWAAAAYTYPAWWLLTPCCAAFYWAVDGARAGGGAAGSLVRNWLRHAGLFVVGMILTTCLMQVCYDLVHGPTGGFFYQKSLDMVRAIAENGGMTSGLTTYGWLKTATWIVFPVLAAASCLITALSSLLRKTRIGQPSFGIIVTYLYAFSVLVLMQIRGTHRLEADFYVSVLIPLAFLAFAATAFTQIESAETRALYAVLACAALLESVPLIVRGDFHTLLHERILWLQYVAGFGALFASIVWRNQRTSMAVILGLAIAGFGLAPDYPGAAWRNNINGIASTKRVADAVRIIDANTPSDKYPVFWIDDYNDRNSAEFRAIMCAFLSHGLSMWNYPSVSPQKKYPPGTELIIITDGRDVSTGLTQMQKWDRPLRVVKQVLISGDGDAGGTTDSYWLTFTKVIADRDN